jgi:hypothetical protein
MILVTVLPAWSSASLQLHQLENGVLVSRTRIQVKRVNWRLVLVQDNPNPARMRMLQSELTYFQRLLEAVPRNLRETVRVPFWMREVERVQRRLRTLLPPREKRGLLDAVGQISHVLFGTATEQEVQSIREKIHGNREAVLKVVHFQNELLTVVNTTRNELINSQKTLNEIINATNSIREWMSRIVAGNKQDIHALQSYNILREKMSLIWHHWEELRHIQEQGDHQHSLLMRGRLSRQLVSSTVFEEVATLHPLNDAVALPAEWYYKHCEVYSIQDHGYTAYVVLIPLVGREVLSGYQIRTFPVPVVNSTTTGRLVADGLVGVNSQGKSVKFMDCLGNEPLVCDPPLVRVDGALTCAQAIVLQERIPEHCEVELRTERRSSMFMIGDNRAVLVTWGGVIIENCAPGNVNKQRVEIGTYKLQWSGRCHLVADHWAQLGVPELSTTITVRGDRWLPWNISELNLPITIQRLNLTHRFSPLSQLQLPQRIWLTPLPSIVDENQEIQNTSYYFWLFGILLLPFIIISFIIYKRSKGNHEETGSQEKDNHYVFKFQTSPVVHKVKDDVSVESDQ